MIWLQPVMVWLHLRNFGLHCPMRIASAHVATTGQLCRQNFVFRQNLEATRLKARQDKRAEKQMNEILRLSLAHCITKMLYYGRL